MAAVTPAAHLLLFFRVMSFFRFLFASLFFFLVFRILRWSPFASNNPFVGFPVFHSDDKKQIANKSITVR